MDLTEACNAKEGQKIKFFSPLQNTNSAGSLALGRIIKHQNEGSIPMVKVESKGKIILIHPLKMIQIIRRVEI